MLGRLAGRKVRILRWTHQLRRLVLGSLSRGLLTRCQDGAAKERLYVDKVHLSTDAYRVWAQELLAMLKVPASFPVLSPSSRVQDLRVMAKTGHLAKSVAPLRA